MNKIANGLRILFLAALALILLGTLSQIFAYQPKQSGSLVGLLSFAGYLLFPLGFICLAVCIVGGLWVWFKGRSKA
jgi:uncharacterized integral membrane protein